MEPSTQKIIHAFGALADLGQEVANTGDFTEMVRTSLHLLLGTLALRRGLVIEHETSGAVRCLAIWGVDQGVVNGLSVDETDRRAFLEEVSVALKVRENSVAVGFLSRHAGLLSAGGIETIVPMVVRSELKGLVLLGGKASGEDFSNADLETIRAMVRHIGVGIHTHRLLEQVAQRAEENRRLYEEL